MKVPLLDLKLQYNSLKEELDEAVLRVAQSQYFILGPEVSSFEAETAEYLNAKYAVGLSSGTDALLAALMAVGIKPGDEVILPTYSFFATIGVISRLNAIPVLVDSDPVSFNINPLKIEEKITSRTKAIIPVHLYGQSADLAPIMELAKKYSFFVIEDAAQAIGTRYKDDNCVGTIGDIGCYSFFPSKNLGGYGDGGMCVTNNPELDHNLRLIRMHGMEPKYYHKIIGGNFRLDAIQAAVLRVKLPHLSSWSEKRRKNAELYNNLFIEKGLAEGTGEIEFSEVNKVLLPAAVYKDSGVQDYHIYNQYIIRVNNRNDLMKFLLEQEIVTDIYYPIPFHLQECYKDLNHSKGDFPTAEFCADHSLALPVFPELREDQIHYVVEKIYEYFSK